MIISGLDLSKNHYCLIMKDITTSQYKVHIGWHTLSAVKKWKKKFPDYTFNYLPTKGKGEDQEHYNMEAGILLADCIGNDIKLFINSSIVDAGTFDIPPVLISLEGLIPYGSRTIDLAETTRPVKEMMYKNGWAIRIHDPQSVKLWAGKGNYDKEQMVRQARKHISISNDFCQSKNPNSWVGADIADAFFLMIMLGWEIKIRQDPTQMKHLSESQIKVVNRVTKTHPINLLDRDFLAIKQPELVIRRVKKKGGKK